jgi:CD109 antigen
VPDSARSYVAITGSLLSQTIQGLDQLLAMPYGCGEQNMLLFAPDTYILKYLQGTSQLTPEVRAKAETLLVTGYQRELTYQRQDGSFPPSATASRAAFSSPRSFSDVRAGQGPRLH